MVQPQAMLCTGDLLEMSEHLSYRAASDPGLPAHGATRQQQSRAGAKG